MKKHSKTLLATLIATSLVGCGSSSSDNETSGSTTTLSGKVIDGYISGATVFLDLNFNSKLDTGEPSAVTNAEGRFDLIVNETISKCALYVPTVTHVPVGAIDSDYPNTPIEEAYTMVSPPSFAMGTDKDLLNLTPLTSVVWDSVENELASAGTTLSCESMLAKEQLRDDITNRLEQQELRVAQRYNITVDELYSDYVKSGDDALHGLAQDLVPGLQASYAETIDLEAAYPDANYVFVEYFLGLQNESTNEYDDNWYRREFVQATNGNWIETVNSMSDDLSTQQAIHSKTSQATRYTDDIEYEEMVSLMATSNWTAESPEYSCGVNEVYLQRGGTVYGISNSAHVMNSSDWSSCQGLDRVASNIAQSLITKIYHAGTDAPYTESNHSFYDGNSSGMAHLIGLGDNIESLDGTELNALNYIATDFDNTDDYGASSWSRVMNEYTAEDSQIMSMHNSDDNYTVTTFYKNGTHSKQCGTYSGGLTGECTD